MKHPLRQPLSRLSSAPVRSKSRPWFTVAQTPPTPDAIVRRSSQPRYTKPTSDELNSLYCSASAIWGGCTFVRWPSSRSSVSHSRGRQDLRMRTISQNNLIHSAPHPHAVGLDSRAPGGSCWALLADADELCPERDRGALSYCHATMRARCKNRNSDLLISIEWPKMPGQ